MKSGAHLVSVWFGIIMVVVLLAASAVFAFTSYLGDTMNGGRRVFFVILLMSYAVYRGIRIYQVIKRNNHEE